jgi:hypothetical protein
VKGLRYAQDSSNNRATVKQAGLTINFRVFALVA